MATDVHPPDALVLALASDDRWLFVGTSSEVIAHAARHRGTGHAPDDPPRATPRVLDFYDDEGRRLSPLVDETLEVHGFAPAGGRAAPTTVRERVERVLAAARQHLEAHPPGATTSYTVGTTVPDLSGDLPEVLRRLHEEEAPPAHLHRSGWFHNLIHALG